MVGWYMIVPPSDGQRLKIRERNLASFIRECVRAGAAGAETHRSLGHNLLHPLILRLLLLCVSADFGTQSSPGCTCTRRSKFLTHSLLYFIMIDDDILST